MYGDTCASLGISSLHRCFVARSAHACIVHASPLCHCRPADRPGGRRRRGVEPGAGPAVLGDAAAARPDARPRLRRRGAVSRGPLVHHVPPHHHHPKTASKQHARWPECFSVSPLSRRLTAFAPSRPCRLPPSLISSPAWMRASRRLRTRARPWRALREGQGTSCTAARRSWAGRRCSPGCHGSSRPESESGRSRATLR